MAEMILPGTYIEVRAEGLITPGRVTVGNIGAVGTASQGPVGVPTLISNYVEARQKFGDYDAWQDGTANELTLVRALELAYAHGANTVIAVRIASSANRTAAYQIKSTSGSCLKLEANSPGTWGNALEFKVAAADQPAYVENEKHNGANPVDLSHTTILKNARNKVSLFTAADGLTRSMEIIYDDTAGAPTADQVKINRGTGELTFAAPLDPADGVTASYAVSTTNSVKVTVRLGRSEEVYTVVDGDDLFDDINRKPGGSAWVVATKLDHPTELPLVMTDFGKFGTGTNQKGVDGADADDSLYAEGMEKLLNEDAHIILACGQADNIGAEINAHCQTASTDAIRHDRIGVIGTALGAEVDTIRGHNFDSDRLIYVAPGIKTSDSAKRDSVTLPGAYTAAAIAGMLAGFSPHISLTNKPLSVDGLEFKYTTAELTQFVQSRVLAVEVRQGFRTVKGITTSTNTAWTQITTRRIVDYAKYGVRSAAGPYIGLLNNERVRGALKSTIASFLNEMVADEMLISYDLTVTATREEERKGIVNVTMVLRPVFSIDFIKVTMFLE